MVMLMLSFNRFNVVLYPVSFAYGRSKVITRILLPSPNPVKRSPIARFLPPTNAHAPPRRRFNTSHTLCLWRTSWPRLGNFEAFSSSISRERSEFVIGQYFVCYVVTTGVDAHGALLLRHETIMERNACLQHGYKHYL